MRVLFAFCVCLAASVVGAAGSRADHPYPNTVVRGQPIVLFAGHSLTDWVKVNGQPSDGWLIDDGAIYRAKRAGDLYHKNTFRDFELYFQWKISAGGNSGVKYRVKQYGNQWLGCEYQLLDDVSAREANKSGALYAIYQPAADKRPAAPEVWHQSKIVVCGNRIEHWLNGQLIVQATVGSQDWKARVQKSKFRDKENFGENREGRIFFQDHGNPVWFRHIVLVPLYCDGDPGDVACSHPPGIMLTTSSSCASINPSCYPTETKFGRSLRWRPLARPLGRRFR